MTPGRNDPCSCGSGKKFKHRCLCAASASADSPEALAWRRVRRALDEFSMAGTMLPCVAETYGPDAFHEAWAEFSGADGPFDPETPHLQVFLPWFLHQAPDQHDPALRTLRFMNAVRRSWWFRRVLKKLDSR